MERVILKLENPFGDAISRVRFAPQSNNLLISSWDSTLRLYDVDTSLLRLESPMEVALLGCCFKDESIAFSIGADCCVRRHDFHSGICSTVGNHDDLATCVEYSEETSQTISAGLDKKIMSWDMRLKNGIRNSKDVGGEVESMSLFGIYLLVAIGASVYKYDLRKLEAPMHKEESSMDYRIGCVRSFPNCEGYAVGSIDGRVSLEFLNLSNANEKRLDLERSSKEEAYGLEFIHFSGLTSTVGELVEQLRLTTLALGSVSAKRQGCSKKKWVSTGDGDDDNAGMDNDSSDAESVKERLGFVAVEAEEDIQNSRVSNCNQCQFRCHPKQIDGKHHLVAVNDLMFHPSRYGAFVSGDNEGFVVMWDAHSRKRLFQFPRYPSSVASLSFNHDGELLAAASSFTYQEANEIIELDLVTVVKRRAASDIHTPNGWEPIGLIFQRKYLVDTAFANCMRKFTTKIIADQVGVRQSQLTGLTFTCFLVRATVHIRHNFASTISCAAL
ncbi:hypothetical protein GIB67_007273 [Kingdonia uniflora]|uniref:Uncharacterized protein n=1 Tax=Kingdonia uniflora TaxID=39325 RepID=A0A7J7NXP5_9MAGN|nr:hypothetical protein GIB67_007273 [Kingdonia uniflora]